MKYIGWKLMLALGVVVILSCEKDPDDLGGTYDKKALFTNYADNVILPSYSNYEDKLDALEIALTDFNEAPDTAALREVQTAVLDAYAAWKSCETFEKIGPAEGIEAISNTNTFPTDTNAVLLNIQNGSTGAAFIQTATNTQKGLPVLEYLFFSRQLSNEQILERFTTHAKAADFKAYATSVVTDLNRVYGFIKTNWVNYREDFINAIGTDAGSSFSALVNSIAIQTDNFKRHQIGIPAGYVGNVFVSVLPTKTEMYHANKSVEYMLLTLDNMERVMKGGSGPGLYDYLKHLNATSTIGGLLADDIMAQLAVCRQKAIACGPDYTATINADKSKSDALFLEAKKLLVLIKVDVPSAVGVSISYSDNDGD